MGPRPARSDPSLFHTSAQAFPQLHRPHTCAFDGRMATNHWPSTFALIPCCCVSRLWLPRTQSVPNGTLTHAQQTHSQGQVIEPVAHTVVVAAMFIFACMFSLALGGLGAMHVYFVLTNQTTIGM